MTQLLVNQLISLLIILFSGLILISWFSPRPTPVDAERMCRDEAEELKIKISRCKDPEKYKAFEIEVDALRKKYRRVDAVKDYAGELHSFIRMRKSDLN